MRLRGRVAVGLALALVAAGVIAGGVAARPHVVAAFAIVDIDDYPRRTDVTACANPVVGKPGVVAFRAMILSQVGGRDDGMAVCKKIANASGSYSDHADGRAWDWHMVASDRSDVATVDRVLDWLLRTDERGQRNAMARRIGLTYIIWNHEYYRVGADDAHWVPYTSTSDPHDTHVHFSFSVAGAMRHTSWWSQRGPLAWRLPDAPTTPVVLGAGGASGTDGIPRPLAGDWNGDGRDTFGTYDPASRQFSLWDGVTADAHVTTTPPIGPFGAIPFTGDWDGVGGGDGVGLFEPAVGRFTFYTRAGAEARPPQLFGAVDDLPIVGDWNGDGVDDIGTYSPGSRTFTMLLPDGSVRTKVFGVANDTPVVGDWNGDGVDDIGVFRSSANTFYFAVPAVDGRDTVESVAYPAIRHLPVVGDWDGNGTDSEGVVTIG